MTANYDTARDRLASMVKLLNTEDDAPVMLLYPMTVADWHSPDADPLLGVIADGDLVALAEHRCDLAALRSEVQRMRDEADTSYQAARKNHEGWWNTTGLFAQQQRHEAWSRMCQLGANRDAYRALLDLIDKHAREGQ